MRKLTSLLLALLMIMSLAACSSPETPASEGAPTDTDANTEQSEATDETAQAQTITAWAWDPTFTIAAFEVAKEIFAQTNDTIEVEVVEYAQEDLMQKINTMLASGSKDGLPNIILSEDYRIQTYIQSYPGSFADMSSIVNRDDFSEYKFGFMTDGDITYGVPFDNSTAVMYYRRDYMEQAGYTDEDMMNMTWEEYIEYGKALKDVGLTLQTYEPGNYGNLRMMMQSAGAWYVEEDGVTPNFVNNDALKYAIELFVQLVEADVMKPTSGWSEYVGSINSGVDAVTITGCWFTANVAQAEDQSGLWGIAPFPLMEGFEGASRGSSLGGSSIYVLDGIEGTDAAIEFLGATFASNPEFHDRILRENNILTTYLPAMETEAYQLENEFFAGQKISADISAWSEDIPSVNYGLHTYAMEDILAALMQNILDGSMTIDEALEAAQTQAEAQF